MMAQDDLTIYQIADLQKDVVELKEQVKECRKTCDKTYVLLARYIPVEKLVYGLVAIILMSVIGAVLALVLTSGKVVHP
jgi:hypothetical protein